MPKYTWEGKTKAGAVQKGVMEAANEAAVEAQLKKYGFSGIKAVREVDLASPSETHAGRIEDPCQ